jgi:16S rRNA (guanine527-N7)-methyltransferase
MHATGSGDAARGVGASLAHRLSELRQEGVGIPSDADARLARYLDLLAKWNRTFNLTAVRDPERMVIQHVVDSLAVLPSLPLPQGGRLLDVGSGAGLPGIPLAVARPDAAVTVLDSSSKKTAFLEQARMELALGNLEVACARIESFRPEHRYDVVISRAFAELGEFVRLAQPLLVPGGRIAAMKGVVPHEELAQLPPGFVAEVEPIRVPGLAAERCLVLVRVAE